MPTVDEFQAFREELMLVSQDHSLGPIIEKKYPRKEDAMAFYNWHSERAREDRQSLWLFSPPTPRADLIAMFDNTNYNDKLQRAKLVSAIYKNVVPWIPVGTSSEGDVFRIVPKPFGLRPDQPNPETDRELAPPNVLGVNLNVQPQFPSHPRISNYSEQSTQSNESDDPMDSGFVFHQIGMLEWAAADEDERKTLAGVADCQWYDTDFGVVMRIDRSGASAGVYIIYDFYVSSMAPPDKRVFERPTTNSSWGQLPELPGRIAVAKIANSLSELSLDRPLSLEVVADYPVELVRAAVGMGNSLIRATVMDDPVR
ncbi:hypothetical protein FQN50_009882 [Emmonsiellopsis sp. PD_5]|nr:hypothetical protein FQN50_009882 [Emmonsiellopsis sp. PD_5]